MLHTLWAGLCKKVQKRRKRRSVMNRFRGMFSVYAAIALLIFGIAGQADAQRRNEREIRDIVRSLNSKVDDLKYDLEYQLTSSSADRQDIDDVSRDLASLEDKIRTFETNLDQRRENRDDVSAILDAARNIDQFLRSNRQNQRIESDWASVRTLLDRLASSYGISRDWRSGTTGYPRTNPSRYPAPSTSAAVSLGLTGTYQLDISKSENTSDIVADANITGDDQRRDLEAKLTAPDQLALDVRGNQVTFSTSNASPITVIADGREKSEVSGGRTVRVRATLRGQELTLSSLGGDTDYTITFVSMNGGQALKVTRRITTEYLQQTVFADSLYNKTDAVARLGIDGRSNVPDDGNYSSNDPTDKPGSPNPYPTTVPGRTGEYVVPNGTVITAFLENEIDTKVSQNNDRFKMTVQTPDEFRGATIEGYISGVGRSGKVTGRSNITFNFVTIKLRSGQTYDFAGFLQAIKDQNGKTVKVDTEGTAKGDSQTKETVKRGGIGAGIGAIIGAIAGGGKGAAIGAIIGGGAGAGSVVVQGRDDVHLFKGSLFTIQASSPIRNEQPVSEN